MRARVRAVAGSTRVPRGGAGVLVGLALFAGYVAVQRGRIVSFDGSVMANLAHNLVERGTLTVDRAVDTLGLQSPHASYGLGTSLAMALPTVLQEWFAPGGQGLVSLTNPLLLAATAGVLVPTGRALGWDPVVSVVVALGFGSLTLAPWLSTEGFSEPGVALGLALALLGVVRWERRAGPLTAGTGVAVAILFRPDSVLLVAPILVAVPLSYPRERWLTRSAVTGVAVPLVAVAALQLWYDAYRYGSVFETGFSQQARGRGFDTPMLEGLDLLLRSPGRGFFFYTPVLLLGLPGAVLLWRRLPALTGVLGLLVAVRLVFFAVWHQPEGGVGWGPRLLFPATVVMAVFAGETLDRLGSQRGVLVASVVLAAMSAGVVAVGLAVPYEQYWRRYVDAPGLTAAERAQRSHDYFWSLRHNAIAGNLALLDEARPFPLRHFAGGVTVPGATAATVAVAGAAAAVAVARRQRAAEGGDSGPVGATRGT